MLARIEAGKKKVRDSGNGRLLNEIEAISKALYQNQTPQKGLICAPDVRSKSVGKYHFNDQKSKPALAKEQPSQKDKKPSIWSWKPLKALSHIRHRRFNCYFSLQVHSIEGLSSDFDGVALCVHWKRRDGALQSRPARVSRGMAEFEETLTLSCSVYGSGNGPHRSAKYEAKYFLLYVSVVDAPELDLGKHRIDLTRLLPLSLEELEEEKSLGKWTTGFKLSGKAKGGTLNVSFSVVKDPRVESSNSRNVLDLNLKQNGLSTSNPVTNDDRSMLRRVGSLSGNPNHQSRLTSQSVDEVKTLHEVLPISRSELSNSISTLYQKFDEEKLSTLADYSTKFDDSSQRDEPLKTKADTFPESTKENIESECGDTDFTIIEHGIEAATKEQVKSEEATSNNNNGLGEEIINLAESSRGDGSDLEEQTKHHNQDEPHGRYNNELVPDKCNSEKESCAKESVLEELESAFHSLSILESAGLDSPHCKSDFTHEENYMEIRSNYKARKTGKSLSMDDAMESVASEFLNMLGIEHSPLGMSSDSEPESPRERLLREFEKDTLVGGDCFFNFDSGKEEQAESGDDGLDVSTCRDFSEDFELSLVIEAAEEHQRATQAMRSKTRAKMLEDLETETLMREWGLNEKAFQNSPPNSAGGFGSPIDLPPEDQLELPTLGEGLGPFVQTQDGGFLRSMNPSLFRNAKNGGSLIMQVSSPVVVPAEMGSGIMEILQRLASVGIEKLSMQANKLMPLEDITGKTMKQVAWEAASRLDASERECFFQHKTEVGQDALGSRKKGQGGLHQNLSNVLTSSSVAREKGSEYVSLEDLAPLAMDKIEALSMEGLRIQTGMSDEDAPSNINPHLIGELSALQGKMANNCGSLGMDGAAGLQLLDIKDGSSESSDVDGLMGLSITLDEWMRLDAGIVDDDEDQVSERTSKILAAHHATCADLVCGRSREDRKKGKGSGRRCGLLGNNFTVALMVQLRDPLRNYEPVGAPMLSLIQVERVFVPPKPKIYSTVSERRNNNEEDDDSELVLKEEINDKAKYEIKDEEKGSPQFKITEVHVAGLKTEPGKKKPWGTAKQQQSGSRWLIASGMGKSNKHPVMKSKSVSKSSTQMTTTVQPGDTLWSISSRVHGTGAKWKELAALNPHIRNPNIIIPNETIRLC